MTTSESEKNQNLFSKAFDTKEFQNFLKARFNYSEYIQGLERTNKGVKQIKQVGTITTKENKKVPVFEVVINNNTQLARNRVGLRNIILQQVKPTASKGALAVFIDENSPKWRLSFMSITPKFDDKSKIVLKETDSKRYTYLLGVDAKVRTATEQLEKLGKQSKLTDIEQAFAVEPLNKEFYQKLFNWYERAQKHVEFPNDLQNEDYKSIALIRLLTRLLFIWFIKQKDLVNDDLFDDKKLKSIIDWDKPSSYYKAILQNLFFATLNKPILKRDFITTCSHFVTNLFRYQQGCRLPLFKIDNEAILTLFKQTPFLNGGLFECLDRELLEDEKDKYPKRLQATGIRIDGFSTNPKNTLLVPNELFFNSDEQQLGLISLLQQYQFTVEESTPKDIEVALDPELLGRVFENLLASYNPETKEKASERKVTGSFYTPRPIVNYMVDTSFKQYLHTKTAIEYDKIDNLFNLIENGVQVDNSQELDFNPEQTQSLIQAINTVKILDPAVGSGAFPMSLLQKMVLLLAELDPENQKWRQQQLQQLPDLASIQRDLKTAKNLNDADAKHKATEELENKKQEIEQAFSQQNHDYSRKLYLIEKCIYGIDIQVIGITISKLRFFISLAIEQEKKPDKDNYGIIPLPNLETKLVAADSLIKVSPIQSDIIHLIYYHSKIEQLQEIRHKYFSAKTLQSKKKCRKEDRELRKEISETLKQQGFDSKTAEQFANWDPYDQNSKADWFDKEFMFGIKNGFDIVIGNPPYIQLQEDKELSTKYSPQNYTTFAKSGNIYGLFYERSHQLLSKNGHLCFITSNTWLRNKYGDKVRNYFVKQAQPKLLLDLGPDVFEDATVNTNILLLAKQPEQKPMQAALITKDNPINKVQTQLLPLPKLGDTWAILSPAERVLKEKIERIGTPLKDWDININYGIKTGFNDAFIIDTAKRDELVTQDPKSSRNYKKNFTR